MNQKYIIGVLVVIILGGAAAWYFSMGSTAGQSATMGDREERGAMEAVSDAAGSFADLFNGTQNAQCRFKAVDPETGDPSQGEIFVSGENYRLEADTTMGGKTFKLYMIQNGDVLYMWSDDTEAMPAMKIDTTAFASMPGAEEQVPESPIDWLKDPQAGATYDCDAWLPRPGTFEPPADVEFFDMFGAMGQMMQGMFDPSMMEGMENWGN